MRKMAFCVATVLVACSVPVLAHPDKGKGDASIPFVNHGGIRDWQAPNDHTLYVQANNGTWYKADLLGVCQGLEFVTRIGFDGGISDTFDRFSKIVVRGQKCQVSSLTKLDGAPQTKAKHHKTT